MIITKITKQILASVAIVLTLTSSIFVSNVDVLAQRVPPAGQICNGPCPVLGNAAGAVADRNTIISFILMVAAFLTYISVGVAVLIMVYGAYLWMNPVDGDGAEKGKTVVMNGAIGLAISILAVTIVTFLSATLSSTNIIGAGGAPTAPTTAPTTPI